MQEIEGTYFHVRVLIGMVVGLAIGNLLRGVARVISDEKHRPIYWVQMVWVLSMRGARCSTPSSPSWRWRTSSSGWCG